MHKSTKMKYYPYVYSFATLSSIIISVVFLFIIPHVSFPRKLPSTALIASLDGNVSLVDSASGRVIWSFSTGSPIYSSYKAPNYNGSFIECGEDWELIINSKPYHKTRLQESIADIVYFVPYVTKEVAITGSQFTTMFYLDAKNGRLHSRIDMKNEILGPENLSLPKYLIKIFRTDYSLKSLGSPRFQQVLWTMKVAKFMATLSCSGNENHLDFAMPYACGDKSAHEVYRQLNKFI